MPTLQLVFSEFAKRTLNKKTNERTYNGKSINKKKHNLSFQKTTFYNENATAADSSQSNISRIYI